MIRTTGLLVKEAAERWEVPARLTRSVRGVRHLRAAAAPRRSAGAGLLFSGHRYRGADAMADA